MADGNLGRIFQDKLPGVDWQRIETGMTGGGVPDLNGCDKATGVEIWIENKFTDAWAVGIRREQVAWIERRCRYNGRVFVATRRTTVAGPRKGAAVDELWLHRGKDIRSIAQYGLEKAEPPLIRCGGGPSQWWWKEIRICLFGAPP
jgi:hypothetical protein